MTALFLKEPFAAAFGKNCSLRSTFLRAYIGKMHAAVAKGIGRSDVELWRTRRCGILCSDWPMVALWKIVEIGRYEGVLCVSSDRRHSRPEDQAPDLLRMTGKRCAMAMAYLLWHLMIASVRRTRSVHTAQQVFSRFTDYLVCLF